MMVDLRQPGGLESGMTSATRGFGSTRSTTCRVVIGGGRQAKANRTGAIAAFNYCPSLHAFPDTPLPTDTTCRVTP